MSTTAQDEAQAQTTITGQTEVHPPIATQTPATAPEGRSNSRSYTLFEEARTDTWAKLGEVEADSPEEAIQSLGEQKLKEQGKRFMAIPTRFVRPRKPKVDTVTTISFD